MPDQGSPASERRAYKRYEIWFPVTLLVGSREVWGISRDVSSKGLLVSTRGSLPVGDPIVVRFRVSPEARAIEMAGCVIRHDENLDDLKVAFPFRLAIEFDHALDHAEEDLEHGIRRALF
jgi:hypothetical protein